jgi:CheY-like chemotaxis protein
VRHSVLLVEDDDDLRTLYGFILANAGFQVKGVRDGFDALTELQVLCPDVIVTDLAMPIVDGITLIEIIKSRAEFADIPVIAMTAYGKTLQRLAKTAGADLAVEKPTELRSICDLVTSVLT